MQDLLAKYGKVTPLLPLEQDAFTGLSTIKRHYRAGTNLTCADMGEPDQLYIVEKGRLFASTELSNGERAITRLYFAGDIVGTANIPFEHATQTITINADAELYIFPRRKLIEAFTSMPRVAAIFYTFAAMENAILNDRLVSIGRTRGKSRLASLIMEIEARRNLLFDREREDIDLGLTQAQIGDAIGLTEVQVSRLFRLFMEEGVIERKNGRTTILDRERLSEIGEFSDRYDDLDINWFEEK